MQYAREITELLGTKDVNAAYLKYAQYRKNVRPRISFMPLVLIAKICYLSSFGCIAVGHKNTIGKGVIFFD